MNNLKILIFISLIFSLALADFVPSKRLRGYVEAPDFLTIQIKGTDCAAFLSANGLSSTIKGGYSGHCLPIKESGEDRDDLTFTGRCLKIGSDIVLSIVDVQRKRSSNDKRNAQPAMQLRDAIPKQEPEHRRERREFHQFYFSFQSTTPVEYAVLSYAASATYGSGHSYEARRPSCIKAIDYCLPTNTYNNDNNYKKEEDKRSDKKEPSTHMVIDCDQTALATGSALANERVYIEITRRDVRPDTCKDPKKGRCCKYVNPNPTSGICSIYSPTKRSDPVPEKKQEEKLVTEKKQVPVTQAKPEPQAQQEEREYDDEEIDPADRNENQKRTPGAEEATEGDEVEFFEEEEEKTDAHTTPVAPAPVAKKEEPVAQEAKKEQPQVLVLKQVQEEKVNPEPVKVDTLPVLIQAQPQEVKKEVVVPVAAVPPTN